MLLPPPIAPLVSQSEYSADLKPAFRAEQQCVLCDESRARCSKFSGKVRHSVGRGHIVRTISDYSAKSELNAYGTSIFQIVN